MDELRTLTASDGAVIAYRLRRSPAARGVLVLLHGAASNMTRWNEYVSRAALRDSWDMLRLDLRGMGRSTYRGRIGMAQWCADLAAILTAEGYSKAVVAGHCLGANIAIEFALRFPDRVAGLILIEPMLRPALTGVTQRLTRLRWLLIALAWGLGALNALGVYRRHIALLDLEQLDRETRKAIAAGDVSEALLDKYASPLLDLHTTASRAYLQALIAVTGRLPDLSAIAVPVFSLLSSGGAFTDPQRTRAALACLSNCEIVALEARHWIPTEQPEDMRAAIENWITRKAIM